MTTQEYDTEREEGDEAHVHDPEQETGDVEEETSDVSDPAGAMIDWERHYNPETGEWFARNPDTGELVAIEPPEDAEYDKEAGASGGDGGEAPPEPQEPAMSEKELGKYFDRIERAGARYKAQVSEFAQQTEQPLVECAVCLPQCPGFHFHPDVVPLTETQIAACRVLAGLPVEPAFEPDPESHECSTCKGWGRVKTGSKVAGQAIVPCSTCNGFGFTTTRERAAAVVAPLTGGPELASPVLSEEEATGADAWGTPRSHPDWGKAPQYRAPGWQEALERYKAGLPAEGA